MLIITFLRKYPFRVIENYLQSMTRILKEAIISTVNLYEHIKSRFKEIVYDT